MSLTNIGKRVNHYQNTLLIVMLALAIFVAGMGTVIAHTPNGFVQHKAGPTRVVTYTNTQTGAHYGLTEMFPMRCKVYEDGSATCPALD